MGDSNADEIIRQEVDEIGRLRVGETMWVGDRALLPRRSDRLIPLDTRAGEWIGRRVLLDGHMWIEATSTDAPDPRDLLWSPHGVAPQGLPDVLGFFTSLAVSPTIMEGVDHSVDPDRKWVVHRRLREAGLTRLDVASGGGVVGARMSIGPLPE